MTREISCGDAFTSTTEGNDNHFDIGVYEDWFCVPSLGDDFRGGDIVYAFDHPGDGDAYIYFDSPCEDLTIFAMYWADEDTCPVEGNYIQECETTTQSMPGAIRIWNNEPRRYLIVVDANEGVEGDFGISVECP